MTISVNVSLVSISSPDQSLTIELTLRQRWPFLLAKNSSSRTPVFFSDLSANVWIPDVFVGNTVHPRMMRLKPLFLEQDEESSLLVSFSRQIVTIRCAMDLFNYPLDHQICPIEFTLSPYPKNRAVLLIEEANIMKNVKMDSVDVSLSTDSSECILLHS